MQLTMAEPGNKPPPLLITPPERVLSIVINFFFFPTRSYLTYFSRICSASNLEAGLTMLIAARSGGLFTGDRAVRRGHLSGDFKTQHYPCCNAMEAETPSHILLHCALWASKCKRFLLPLLHSIPSNSLPFPPCLLCLVLSFYWMVQFHKGMLIFIYFAEVISVFFLLLVSCSPFPPLDVYIFPTGKSLSPHKNGSPSYR